MGLPDGKQVEGSVYFYAPNKYAPAIFAVLFFLSGAFHLWQCIKHKAFKITGIHPFCCLMFVVGFALREYGAFNYDNLGIYIASTICIYTAPPLLELANYHVLGRILYYVPYFTPLHPGRTLTTFGSISFVVEILNALGVAQLANTNLPQSRQDLGHIFMKIALITQIFVITSFVALAGVFHWRCRRGGITHRNVNGPLYTMYASSALIMIRTIFRTIEHFGISRIPAKKPDNWDPMRLSPLVRYEWFFWVFEAVLMYWNSVLWNARHPRHYLPEDYHVYLAQDGKTELKGPGWEDDLPWFVTFIDPCGLTAWVIKKERGGKNGPKEKKKFWETNGFENVPLVRRGPEDEV